MPKETAAVWQLYRVARYQIEPPNTFLLRFSHVRVALFIRKHTHTTQDVGNDLGNNLTEFAAIIKIYKIFIELNNAKQIASIEYSREKKRIPKTETESCVEICVHKNRYDIRI